MVPQQCQDGNTVTSQPNLRAKDESDLSSVNMDDSTVFGSQQVKETSNTPYTDATQVSHILFLLDRKQYHYPSPPLGDPKM